MGLEVQVNSLEEMCDLMCDNKLPAIKRAATDIANDIEYLLEQIEQNIFMLEEDIKDGEGTVVTRTKLAVYAEVRDALNEILEVSDGD
jgi:hypothetical protein